MNVRLVKSKKFYTVTKYAYGFPCERYAIIVLDNSRRIKLGSRMGVSPQDENSFAPGVIYLDLPLGFKASITPVGLFFIFPKTLFFRTN